MRRYRSRSRSLKRSSVGRWRRPASRRSRAHALVRTTSGCRGIVRRRPGQEASVSATQVLAIAASGANTCTGHSEDHADATSGLAQAPSLVPHRVRILDAGVRLPQPQHCARSAASGPQARRFPGSRASGRRRRQISTSASTPACTAHIRAWRRTGTAGACSRSPAHTSPARDRAPRPQYHRPGGLGAAAPPRLRHRTSAARRPLPPDRAAPALPPAAIGPSQTLRLRRWAHADFGVASRPALWPPLDESKFVGEQRVATVLVTAARSSAVWCQCCRMLTEGASPQQAESSRMVQPSS